MSFALAHQAVQEFMINKRYSTPAYDSINAIVAASNINTNIVVQNLEDSLQVGKNRTLKVSFYPIDCNNVASDCNSNLCDTGAVQAPIQEYFTISRCTATKKKQLRSIDVRDVDGNWNFSEHAMAQINSGMGSWRKAFATQLDALLLANAGLQLNGNPTNRVTMTNNTNGVVFPQGLFEIEQNFNDGGFTNPFIIGSTEVFQWKKALEIASPNTITGQDFTKLGDTNMFYDTLLNSVAGDTANGEHIIAFDPQALKFMAYNQNLGIFATDLATPAQMDAAYKRGGTDYIRGFFRDPVTGLMLDFYMKYDECNDVFNWDMKLHWDIFFPSIQACNIQGVNGIFHYRTCPIKLAPCPSGDTPSPMANPVTYSWTPGLTNPTAVFNLTIGGHTSQPNLNVTDVPSITALLNDVYGQPIFTTVGSSIHYTGYAPLTGSMNNGAITITFA